MRFLNANLRRLKMEEMTSKQNKSRMKLCQISLCFLQNKNLILFSLFKSKNLPKSERIRRFLVLQRVIQNCR